VIEWLNANRRQYSLTGPMIVLEGFIYTPSVAALLTGTLFAFEYRRSGHPLNDNEVRR